MAESVDKASRRSMGVRVLTVLFGPLLKLDDLDEADRRRIRAAQIAAVVQLVPLTMTVNILNATITAYVFWNTGSNLFLGFWVMLVALQAAAGLISWRLRRDKPPFPARQGERQ